ncbi:MAG: STAS domain-containing protein [Woeseiaceae bacterium]
MSDYELVDDGGGKFSLKGRMTFNTAGDILRDSEEPFEKHTRIEVLLDGVTETDSAGLALLLEWITWANHTVREITFTGVPEKINAIARTTEVDNLLTKGERWAGFIEAPSVQESTT